MAADILVLGSPGPTQVVGRDPSVKKCRHSKANRASMLEAVCTNLELHDIPTNLKENVEVRLNNIVSTGLCSYVKLIKPACSRAA